ncbi:PucR family transcriptional regulator [Neobacillus sp. NPDC097160]|uniref:PucR family transcriptional regulator n=1 Tax=Neobacillus sp. NPDC097160 TaxID=3364298 RepID=UPI00381A8ACA
MLRKLLSLFKNSILFPSLPEIPSEQFHYFFSEAENEWIGIPKTAVSEKELNLLKVLYKLGEFQVSRASAAEKGWHEYLFLNAPPPQYHSETYIRFIQFSIHGDEVNQVEIESALKGFFTEEVIIIWESASRGIVVEEKKQISLSEEELISMSETLESDFYVKISFFIGKLNLLSEAMRTKFLLEQEYFSFAISKLGNSTIFTFERVFPAYLAHHLPEELKYRGSQEIVEVFREDPEMFSTIKVFLENNSNASMTAKKLYIHRNTLQYRIDKFTEKTGIGLKDFYGAFTVFLACLLFEQNQKN